MDLCRVASLACKPSPTRLVLLCVSRPGDLPVCPPFLQSVRFLQTLLAEQVPLAVAINTEKARSEMIVVNVLAEVRRQMPGQISLFSGVELDVEKTDGLKRILRFPHQFIAAATHGFCPDCRFG